MSAHELRTNYCVTHSRHILECVADAEKHAEEAEYLLLRIRDFAEVATVEEILPQLEYNEDAFTSQLSSAKEEVERLKRRVLDHWEHRISAATECRANILGSVQQQIEVCLAAAPSPKRSFDALVSKMSPEAQTRTTERAEKMLTTIDGQCFLCVQDQHVSHSPLVGYICVGSVFDADKRFVKMCQCQQRGPVAAPSPEGKEPK